MSYLVGLTGGIGSGKSTVANLFAKLDVPIIDTDIISHQLTQTDGAAISAIRTEFGEEYIDSKNALDRKKMREFVFSNPAALIQLENILHPLILKQTKSLANSNTHQYLIIVIPLLFESNNYINWLNQTLVVDCSENVQITRACTRKDMNESKVRAIMKNQISRTQRLKLADKFILNEGTLDDLRQHVSELHSAYLALSKRSN
jgi:dephospho-CoA kinase